MLDINLPPYNFLKTSPLLVLVAKCRATPNSGCGGGDLYRGLPWLNIMYIYIISVQLDKTFDCAILGAFLNLTLPCKNKTGLGPPDVFEGVASFCRLASVPVLTNDHVSHLP